MCRGISEKDVGTYSEGMEYNGQSLKWAKAGDSVLDLCCGSGHLAFLLSEKVGCSGKVVFFFGSRVSILDINKSEQPFITLFQEWTIDNVIVPIASQFGVKHEYTYLKRSIEEFATGSHASIFSIRLAIHSLLSSCKLFQGEN
ncbi:2-phytyl-1,4-beta-naphthoquinone methyltransferase, chloroplastic-like isoform X2 [Amborella trichopoda]|uniref:2-phytyl-1,4-beta-naphthoquinone methyltransferase, chloroplastic-like isoform X2 n=1 Tax=Amborella trichopoda TaxID=13333 RepID=UPI0009BEEE60|nr:2-phytyl-1,4-beta-naphthoquinone methyltransferase, chloroplastic-like isoform X2 [Amborella trichopoda]|eukprot:XP_020520809.1 2-phytyl-1,4-beta-naphthoquinone methyltransferase, chloroplastic-like isoform X2 [Amborella trichopoda]